MVVVALVAKLYYSSVVMKYFVSDKFRLLYFLIATKGAACRELLMLYSDFYTSQKRLKARHAVSYMCGISTFPFVSGQRGFLKATKGAACRELCVCYFDFSVHKRATRARHDEIYH